VLRAIVGGCLSIFACCIAFGQTAETNAKFEAADVHTSAKAPNPFARTGPTRGGRYEVKTATMVDLIRLAYGLNADKILGGPSWLETDRFDVVAKIPADSTPETQKLMLQSLLADRFKLVVHREVLTCQNVTMAQFADRLLNMTQDLNWPVLDATELEGGWDFTLMFSMRPPIAVAPGREAVEKQLGLKLEKQKRSMPVIVIDHIEQKPTEN
jgi:hypothetical protein